MLVVNLANRKNLASFDDRNAFLSKIKKNGLF